MTTDPTLGSTVADTDDQPAESSSSPTFDRPEQRFALAEEIGRGGMGRVVAATDISLARTVAVKQVLSDRPDDLARFEREVRITAQLEHPSIVPIYEAARDAKGRPFYVMRRIAGEPLSKRLGGADVRARLALLPNLLAVVDAAAFAHARRIIHRDIKPSNILLGDYGETHLIDWGLARHIDDQDISQAGAETDSEQLTRAGHVYGTIAYMAPEQARGEPVDMRADVYALGATLFHVLAGKAPFAELSDAERIAAAESGDDAAPIAKLPSEVSSELVAIVTKAMASDAAVRYANAGELAVDLRAFLAGQLVGAHRYTLSQRITRFVRRHRFAVASVVLALAAIGVISGLAISNILRSEQQALDAQKIAEAGRVEANDRAEIALLDRASSLAPTNPTRAAVMLRDIPVDSRHANRARDIASSTAGYGIVRGAHQHTKQINAMEFSPDGRTLASTGEDGRVILYEVATGRPRILAELKQSLFSLAWNRAGSRVLVTGHTAPLQWIDVASGRSTIVAPTHAQAWFTPDERIRFFDLSQKTIFEIPATGGDARPLATDVVFAHGVGAHVVYLSTTKQFFVLTDGAARPLDGELAGGTAAMAISPRGDRVAAAGATEVAEWDLATGRRTGTWPLKYALRITYGPDGPIAVHGEGKVTRFFGAGSSERAMSTSPTFAAQISSGSVLLFEAGHLLVNDIAGPHLLPYDHPGSRVLASHGMHVAMGSRDGTVRWLDLQWVTPQPYPVPPRTQVCLPAPTTLFLLGDGVAVLDLVTRTRKQLADPTPFENGGGCGELVGPWFPVWNFAGAMFVDIHTGKVIKVPLGRFLLTEDKSARFAIGNELRELGPNDSMHRLRWRAPAPIRAHARFGRWTLLVLDDDSLVRLDDASSSVETRREPDVRGVTIAKNGTAYFSRDRTIYEWSGSATRTHELPSAVDSLFAQRDLSLAIRLENGSLWLLDGGPPRQRSAIGLKDAAVNADGVFVHREGRKIIRSYLRSGESITRDSTVALGAGLLPDGSGVIGVMEQVVVLYPDPVPPTFAETRRWIDQATNAAIVPGSMNLHWK